MFTDEQLNKVITFHTCVDNGFCFPGSRLHVEALGLNYRQCLKNGITVRDALQLDDCLMNRLIEIVTKEG